MIVNRSIDVALHWWFAERMSSGILSEEVKNNLWKARTIILFMFQTLDSLYVSTRQIPSPWSRSRLMSVKAAGTNSLLINIGLDPNQYQLLRTILTMTGDVYFCCEAILNTCKGNLTTLEPLLQQLLDNANQYRDLRNFFTHLSNVLRNLDKYGVTGSLKTNCGIEYMDTAKGSVHIILSGNTIFFTYCPNWQKKAHPQDCQHAKEVDIGIDNFNKMFESTRLIYTEITSHKLLAQQYPSPNTVYPL